MTIKQPNEDDGFIGIRQRMTPNTPKPELERLCLETANAYDTPSLKPIVFRLREAAATIASLTAERDAAREDVQARHDLEGRLNAKLEAAENRVKELEAALKKVSKYREYENDVWRKAHGDLKLRAETFERQYRQVSQDHAALLSSNKLLSERVAVLECALEDMKGACKGWRTLFHRSRRARSLEGK